MSVKIKKFIFSSVFYVLAITIVGLVAFQASTYADKQANYHDIAQVQVTVNALKHCLDDADAFHRGDDRIFEAPSGGDVFTYQEALDPIKANDASQGNIFERTWFGFETGYWLEKQISGKATDHKLRCSEQKSKIVQFTASKLGIPLNEILCDKAKGLKTKGVLEPSHRIGSDIDESITCDNFSSGQDYYRAVSSDALAHLKKLYKTWQANNPGAVKWGQLSEDVGPAAYYKYFDSFLAGCTKDGVIEEATGKTTAFNTKWRRLGTNGKVKEVKIKKRSDYSNYDCENLIGEMNKHFKKNESAIVQEMVENGVNSTTPPVADSGTKESTEEETFTNNCFNQTGAIGWLICPAITLINGALETAYNNLIEPMLQVSPELVQPTGDDAATYQAWSIFRNFANIIFILLFLGVIISQVTGLGIDNYGIKKILPKLIIVAILINLSFYICQLAVDISNLLGYSFRTLFTNLVGNIGDGSSASTAGKFTADAFSLAVAGGGIFAAFGSATLALIIPLLTVLASALISILFLFIILVARKSIIILLIAISPVAFALYALPNTNPLFKKWFSLFKTLLIVYPICGLLIGAGALASSVVSRAGAAGQEGVTILVGILIQIVPYFFIPSLVKKSVDGLGGLGSRIAGFNKFSGALNKRARDGVSNARTQARANRLNSRFSNFQDKLAYSKFGKSLGISKSRARSAQALKKNIEEQRSANAILQGRISDYEEQKSGNTLSPSEWEAKLANLVEAEDRDGFYAAYDDMVRHIGEGKSAGIMRNLTTNMYGKGLLGNKNRASFLRETNERYGFINSKDYSLGRYMTSGAQATLGEYDRSGFSIDDVGPSEIISANAPGLEGFQQNSEIWTQSNAALAFNKLPENTTAEKRMMIGAKAIANQTLSKRDALAILNNPTEANLSRYGMTKAQYDEIMNPRPQEVRIVGGGSPSGSPSGGPQIEWTGDYNDPFLPGDGNN